MFLEVVLEQINVVFGLFEVAEHYLLNFPVGWKKAFSDIIDKNFWGDIMKHRAFDNLTKNQAY